MGFYAHLKGANLEISRNFSSQFIRDEQGEAVAGPGGNPPTMDEALPGASQQHITNARPLGRTQQLQI